MSSLILLLALFTPLPAARGTERIPAARRSLDKANA
jgi:hypothetical protein